MDGWMDGKLYITGKKLQYIAVLFFPKAVNTILMVKIKMRYLVMHGWMVGWLVGWMTLVIKLLTNSNVMCSETTVGLLVGVIRVKC